MTPEIAKFIISQHLYSPAMRVILPLQDWFAIDENVRLSDAHAERINLCLSDNLKVSKFQRIKNCLYRFFVLCNCIALPMRGYVISKVFAKVLGNLILNYTQIAIFSIQKQKFRTICLFGFVWCVIR